MLIQMPFDLQNKKAIRAFLTTRMGKLDEHRMRRFWVLAEVDGQPFRDCISELVVGGI